MNAENTTLSKQTTSFAVSLAVASVVNGLLVVAKEKSPAVMAGMKRLTGHHWITHSIIVIALFFLLGWILGQTNRGSAVQPPVKSIIRTLAGGVILGGLIIVGFYLLAD